MKHQTQSATELAPIRGFRIGDLLTHPQHGRGLLIEIDQLLAEYWADYHLIIDEKGHFHTARLWQPFEKWKRSHPTSLHYSYQSHQQAGRDFATGTFTPYFNL